MIYSSVMTAEEAMQQPLNPGSELKIAGSNGTEPILTKALSILASYDEAIGCSTVILDLNGQAIGTQKFKKQMKFCEFCSKYCQNPSPGLVRPGIWEGNKLPCEKVHAEAVAESRRINEPYIYTCAAGFAYWTSPFYRNQRHAGSLTSGGVLFCRHNEAVEKIKNLCKDSIVSEKFNKMLGDVAEKSHNEIQAMAKLLGVCAEEISKDSGNSNKKNYPTSWNDMEVQKEKKSLKTQNKESTDDEPWVVSLIEEERMLLAAFKRGDSDTGNRILTEIMKVSIDANPGNFEATRLKAIELLVLLSRAALNSDSNGESLAEINDFNLKRLQEAKTTEELTENLCRAAGRMSGKIFSFKGIRHASALRKAQRYIWENYTRKISLEEIAKASGLSAPYFSTIFNEEMGEKLSSYLNRLRVERAAALLKETGKSLNEIADLCGFEDQSWFSKVFKSITGMSPGKHREKL